MDPLQCALMRHWLLYFPASSHQVLWAALLQVIQLPVHICQVLVNAVQLCLKVFVLLVVAVKISLVIIALLFVCDSGVFTKLWKQWKRGREQKEGMKLQPAEEVPALLFPPPSPGDMTVMMCFLPVKVVIVQLVAGGIVVIIVAPPFGPSRRAGYVWVSAVGSSITQRNILLHRGSVGPRTVTTALRTVRLCGLEVPRVGNLLVRPIYVSFSFIITLKINHYWVFTIEKYYK